MKMSKKLNEMNNEKDFMTHSQDRNNSRLEDRTNVKDQINTTITVINSNCNELCLICIPIIIIIINLIDFVR